MDQESFNPSPLEVEFANAIEQVSEQLAGLIPENRILHVEKDILLDNPQLKVTLENNQGRKREVVIRIIQRIDQEIGDI